MIPILGCSGEPILGGDSSDTLLHVLEAVLGKGDDIQLRCKLGEVSWDEI
jgi:hypothetical protein